jgi:dipeptidyl aminopeptidase/acylaminoacyl peptidase
MPETKQLLRETRDRIAPPPDVLGGLERRRRHKEGMKRLAAAVFGIVVALVGLGSWFVLDRAEAPTPASPPEDLGIFAPVAGRIVYRNDGVANDGVAPDLGYASGMWAVDPSGPSDTTEGQFVADDVASTLVRLGPEEAIPLGWSSDGTELLFMRTDGYDFPQDYLYVLHADGSETQVTTEPMNFDGATISPDGSRVVFAAWGDDLGLYAIDADGGTPEVLLLPGGEDLVYGATFSPDATQIAYVRGGGDHDHDVWVMDADGADAHKILTIPTTAPGTVSGIEWSPAGDRIALGLRALPAAAIYTFAPDGSDFTQVITDAIEPHWSPDGSQLAFVHAIVAPCGDRPPAAARRACFGVGSSEGLGIANADGSDARTFGFAASGPWHPGVSPNDEPVPTPA